MIIFEDMFVCNEAQKWIIKWSNIYSACVCLNGSKYSKYDLLFCLLFLIFSFYHVLYIQLILFICNRLRSFGLVTVILLHYGYQGIKACLLHTCPRWLLSWQELTQSGTQSSSRVASCCWLGPGKFPLLRVQVLVIYHNFQKCVIKQFFSLFSDMVSALFI